MAGLRNAMTIDVEDYFQVSAFEHHIARDSWDKLPCRVERNMDVILGLLAQHGTQATFFTLGWIAERYPHLIRRIVAEGHELASHGYEHLRASDQSPAEFTDDVTRAKKLLEDLGGIEVTGYRAPSFSIGAGNLWALEALKKAGYYYSSSIYPVARDHYGMPDAPRFAYLPPAGQGLLEVPPTTVRMFNRNLPASGGGFFRLFPYHVSRALIERVNRVDAKPAIFYLHPWEVDPEQPRQQGISFKTRVRHYLNLSRTEVRLAQLLQDFQWGRMDRIFLEGAHE
ncbi:XrtA system polysaccharide deacetylase [Chitinivorax sp. B]|uniref:XrtA system polysaccharide deacetylase n=1 Tax=Chitinivorax sp. B TaxID=2502235 RepID=UPI0020173551|nr:XrtA system polysaccharide deacetylase [Chitinivorax sp. B]